MAGVFREDDETDEQADLNVTPFIDVMLVLLIIFMIAAPLSTVDIAVQLPASSARAERRPDKPIFITVAADLSVSVGDAKRSATKIVADVDGLTEANKDTRLFLRADKGVPYGDVIDVLERLRDGGYTKVGLVMRDAGRRGPTLPGLTTR